PIPVCLRANSTACAWHNNTPSSGVSGSSASRMPTRPPHNTPYANGSNSFYPNSLSSWRCLGFLPTTTSPNEVSALWSSLARSAAAHAVPMAQRLAWVWPLYLEPGWPNISILSASALPCCPPHLLWVNSELYPGKSSFVKNIGYVLSNRAVLGKPASKLFEAQLSDPHITELVDFINVRIPTEVI